MRAANATVWGLLGIVVLVALLWLPFSLNTGATIDDWTMKLNASEGRIHLWTPQYAPTRPLTYAPFWFGHALTPDSFVGFNLVLIGLMIGKGALMLLLCRRWLPAPAAAWIGLLFTVYPADDALFYMGALNVHLHVLLVIGALLGLTLYAQTRRLVWLVVGMGAQILALLVYEVGIPLLTAAPLLLWLAERRLTRRIVIVGVLWSAVPLASFAISLAAVASGDAAYQRGLLDGGSLGVIANGFTITLRQNLAWGFVKGARGVEAMLNGVMPAWYLALVGAAAVVLGLIYFTPKSRHPTNLTPKSPLRREKGLETDYPAITPPLPMERGLGGEVRGVGGEVRGVGGEVRGQVFLIGIAALLLGVALYAPTQVFVDLPRYSTRAFFLSSAGAALAVGAGTFWLAGRLRRPRLAHVVLFTLTLLGFARLLSEHHEFAALYGRQQDVLLSVYDHAPNVTEGSMIVILDDPAQTIRRTFVYNYPFEQALLLTTGGQHFQARLCYARPNTASEMCTFNSDGATLPGMWVNQPQTTIPYDRLIVFQYHGATGAATLLDALPLDLAPSSATYEPRARIVSGDPPPRVRSLLG